MQIIVQHFRQPQPRGGILQDNSKIIPIKLKLLVKLSRALLSFHSMLLISSSFTSCSIRNHGQCFILHNSVPGSFFLNISVSWSDSSESELWLAACKVHLALAANVKKKDVWVAKFTMGSFCALIGLETSALSTMWQGHAMAGAKVENQSDLDFEEVKTYPQNKRPQC